MFRKLFNIYISNSFCRNVILIFLLPSFWFSSFTQTAVIKEGLFFGGVTDKSIKSFHDDKSLTGGRSGNKK